jgi:drug/metabolite transporter (DMT)-like permease
VSLIVMVVAAGLGILLYVAGVKALRHLEASTYAVVYSTRIVVATVLAALVLSELPTVLQCVGGLAILASVVLLRQKGARTATKQGIIWALVAAASASTLALAEKWLIVEVGLFNAAPFATGIGAAIMWAVVWARRLPVPLAHIATRQMAGLLVLRTIASWAWIFALAAGVLVSIATYVSSLSVVIVSVLGVWLLREREYLLRKLVAVVVAVIGLSLILLT